ncbi:MAG TPA: hypothetical protein VIS96_17910 [Terrimicrobiaceae bacterium]
MLVNLSRAVLGSQHALIGLLLLVGLSLTWGEPVTAASPSKNLLTANCDPCTFEIAQKLAPYQIRFRFRNLPDDRRVIQALEVFTNDKPGWTQSLAVHDMTPVKRDDKVVIGTADINFDGYNDLLFATSRGIANSYADYWLFAPSTQEFKYLGNYPIFALDSRNHRLSTYERGGHAGMIYQSKHYRFIDGVLTLVESETQEATEQDGVYLKRISRLKNGHLRQVKRELIKVPPLD